MSCSSRPTCAGASLMASQLDAVLFVLDDSKTKPAAARTALNQLSWLSAVRAAAGLVFESSSTNSTASSWLAISEAPAQVGLDEHDILVVGHRLREVHRDGGLALERRRARDGQRADPPRGVQVEV